MVGYFQAEEMTEQDAGTSLSLKNDITQKVNKRM